MHDDGRFFLGAVVGSELARRAGVGRRPWSQFANRRGERRQYDRHHGTLVLCHSDLGR